MFASRGLLRVLLPILFTFAAAGPASSADALWKPDRTVTLVVPYSAGGGTDAQSRAIARELQRIWGQPVIVDNTAGADGLIGTRKVIDAKPDGLTLLVQIPSVTLIKNVPAFKGIDPVSKLIPVSAFAYSPAVFVANSRLPGKTMAEVVLHCKTAAQPCSIGTTENIARLMSKQLGAETGIDNLIVVNYKGGGQLINDLVANNVNMAFMGVISALPHYKTGSLKVLTTLGPKRAAIISEVPTTAEAGFPSFKGATWYGLFAPQGTPLPVVQAIAAAVNSAVKEESVLKSLPDSAPSPSATRPQSSPPWSATKRSAWTLWPSVFRLNREAAVSAKQPSLSSSRPGTAWLAEDLERDNTWIHRLDDADSEELLKTVRRARVSGRPLLEYERGDFPLTRSMNVLKRAFNEAQHGHGLALLKGLPRQGVSPQEFELMTWAIGLHFGVARPQDKLTRYINEVKDVGGVYRSPTGRGYSSNAELDFHVDGADVVVLSCYNQAPVGGDSMCSSSVAAFQQLQQERPDLAAVLQEPVAFSRQGEQAEGLEAFMLMPIYAARDGEVSCMWVRNRVENGEKLAGAPKLTLAQREAMDLLDAIVRRPQFMYAMRLEPGDLQILRNHTVLHSRTEFQDAEADEDKRLLYRLWLSTPDAAALPVSWGVYYESVEQGVVRGGSHGQHYTDACRAFDARQAKVLGMRLGPGISR